MIWRDEWASVAARIDGLLNAAQFFVHTLSINRDDEYHVADKYIAVQAREIVGSLPSFLASHGAAVPQGAAMSLDRFLRDNRLAINNLNVKGLSGLKLRITLLAALRAEVEYHLSDFEAMASKKAERAFLHLQQSIVVDGSVRSNWKKAFDHGEVMCETLGAAHLMLHGIWAFKVDAKGGRTDLVLGGSLTDSTNVSRVADALVLTEWKRVGTCNEVEEKAEQARAQIQLYAAGILAGIELSRYRYVVLVSKKQLAVPDDARHGPATCRHVNIAVEPVSPSVAARR